MREKERGFALLLVFMLAASVCIYLYMQMPRVAFEAQRAKVVTLQASRRETAEQLCDGSLTPLLTHLVSAGRLSAEELRDLRPDYPLWRDFAYEYEHERPEGEGSDCLTTSKQGADDEDEPENAKDAKPAAIPSKSPSRKRSNCALK